MTKSKITSCSQVFALGVFVSVAQGQPLRELAVKHGILIGTAHSGRSTDAEYLNVMAREFNLIEPENATKFGPIHPDEDVYNFSTADGIVSYAARNAMRVRGHVFVWHNQVPGWVTNGKFTPEQLSEILHKHILTVGGRYRGKIYAWDVVNEAFLDNGSLRETVWRNQPGIGLKGTAYIDRAFRWAREADPNALLFYNDYGAEAINAKADAIYSMAVDFKARGVPIDGIGLQAHFTPSMKKNLPAIDANIKRITALGLQVQITEMDVRLRVDANGKASAADLAAQADLYSGLAAICFKYPLCTALQFWGFTDKYSWIPRANPGFGAALPLDESYQPKSAYTAIRDALIAAPKLSRPTAASR